MIHLLPKSSDVPTERIARITVQDYHQLLKSSMLRDGDPIELLDGLLVYKDRSARGKNPMSVGELHNLVVKLLARLDALLVPLGCHMQTQGPLALPPHDEPEPDGAIVRGEPRDYRDRLPSGADAYSAIEVADSSLAFDRRTKLARYAAAGIPQYVIINLVELQVEVHEQPIPGESRYAQVRILKAGEQIALHAGTVRLEVPVQQLLP